MSIVPSFFKINDDEKLTKEDVCSFSQNTNLNEHGFPCYIERCINIHGNCIIHKKVFDKFKLVLEQYYTLDTYILSVIVLN